MFNVPLNAGVPGFRVGLQEDLPSFNIDSDGSARRAVVNSSGYDAGNLTRSSWGNPIGLQSWTVNALGQDSAALPAWIMMAASGRSKHEECVGKCLHLLPSPSGDLQSSEFRKCYRECMGSLL